MTRFICSHASPEKTASFLIAETTSYLIYTVLISTAKKEEAARKEQRGGGLRGKRNTLYLQINNQPPGKQKQSWV